MIEFITDVNPGINVPISMEGTYMRIGKIITSLAGIMMIALLGIVSLAGVTTPNTTTAATAPTSQAAPTSDAPSLETATDSELADHGVESADHDHGVATLDAERVGQRYCRALIPYHGHHKTGFWPWERCPLPNFHFHNFSFPC